ncbi:reverse transcriptase domain-containing protein [Tanacetum coccineum]
MEKYLKKHTTLNLEYHSSKEEDIEQLLWESTNATMEILQKMALVELMYRKESTNNLKWLLMEKLRMGYQIEVSTNMHDSLILEDSLPTKEKDSGSFTIPCYINNTCFKKALADLGASVSVMPYSAFTNLGLGELTPTKLIIILADRTMKHPKGIAENLLVEFLARVYNDALASKSGFSSEPMAPLFVYWSTWWFRDSLAYLKLSLGSSIYRVWNRVDTPYRAMWDTAYWGFLGVRTTFDIFQNILLLYCEYYVLMSLEYGVLGLQSIVVICEE